MEMNAAGLIGTQPATGSAKSIVQRLFRTYTGGLCIRFWNGETLVVGAEQPTATITFHSAGIFRELVLKCNPLTLCDAYFSGKVEVDGDLYALLSQKDHFRSLKMSVRERLSVLTAALLIKDRTRIRDGEAEPTRWKNTVQARASRKASKSVNRDAIAFHYDVSNDFYRLFSLVTASSADSW